MIVPHPDRTLAEGAIDPWTKPRYETQRRTLLEFARQQSIPTDVAWNSLTQSQRDVLLHHTSGRARSGRTSYVGIFPLPSICSPLRWMAWRLLSTIAVSSRRCSRVFNTVFIVRSHEGYGAGRER